MRLVELQSPSGSPIWVNPGSVAFIEQSGANSMIFFAAIAEKDAVLARLVSSSPSQVAEQLNAALRDS